MEMAQAKVIFVLPLLFAGCVACAQTYTWTQVPMDGSRVGATIPTAENVREALGSVENGVYTAPNGRTYTGMVADVASIMLEAQQEMAPVKEYLGYASEDMICTYPESALSNMLADCIKSSAEEVFGRKVDVSMINFGGIRVDLYKGNIIMDDIMSMLPFKNYLCYVALKGSDLRAMFEKMASTRVQVFGGVRLTIKDRKLEEVLIGGEPLDDERVYGLATVDFLLNGGDDIFAARNARELIISEVLVRDTVLPYIRSLTARGKPVCYSIDGRVKIIKEE